MPGELPNDYGSFKANGTEGAQDSILCQHILLQNLRDCRANARAGPVGLRSLLSGCWVCRADVVGHPGKVSEPPKNPGNEAPVGNFFAGEMGTAMAVKGSQVFYVEYCSHFKLNIKLSLEHSSVSQSEKNSSAFQCTI